ncbi:TPA: hypothetical protein IZ416_002706, partial [Enterococcus faecium]|nr:hypothetical protein [Enterococcus faecium]HAQ4126739.1 hypothetical protein [Enterococcus faecium]HAR1557421.1 hypothetical protein [Enterococcus faecium]
NIGKWALYITDIPSFGKNVTIFISNIVSGGINDEDNISIVVDSVALNDALVARNPNKIVKYKLN